MQVAIRYGLILGVLSTLLSLFNYLMGVEYTMSYTSVAVSSVIFIGAVIFVCNRIKAENKGIIKYFDAVKLVFVSFMLAYVISSSYNLIFNNFIAPEYNQEIAKVSLDKATELMESAGMPESKIDETINEARQEVEKNLANPFIPFLQGIMMGAVGLFVVALLAAIFVQRKPVEGEFLYDDDVLDDSSNKESW